MVGMRIPRHATMQVLITLLLMVGPIDLARPDESSVRPLRGPTPHAAILSIPQLSTHDLVACLDLDDDEDDRDGSSLHSAGRRCPWLAHDPPAEHRRRIASSRWSTLFRAPKTSPPAS
jgi:hypothetical protein